MGDKVRIEGAERIERRLEALGDTERLYRAIGRGCALVERTAKQKAPKPSKDNGEHLRTSITSKIEEQNGDLVGIVYSPLLYAPYVEYGTGLFAENGGRKDVPWIYQDDEGIWHSTSGQKPRPFMRPALNENREEILRILKEGVADD